MSSRNSLIGALLLVLGLAGCQQNTQEQAALPVDLNQVKADLETVAQARIFFAHQSVGRNMLKGIAMLSEETGVALRIEEVMPGGPVTAGPGLFHANVGENGVADSKISAFVSDVTAPGTAPFDVALLKFCYTDLGGEARDKSPQELFARYQRAMASVKEQQPNLTLLHATMPLRAELSGVKTKVKRMLGMSAMTDADNILRGEYNALIRKEPPSAFFDVARLEATRPDGSITAFKAQGRDVEMMAAENTYDGGHLTDPAKRYFAAALLHKLAETVRARSAAESSGT
jgi:hypothetical protein